MGNLGDNFNCMADANIRLLIAEKTLKIKRPAPALPTHGTGLTKCDLSEEIASMADVSQYTDSTHRFNRGHSENIGGPV